MRMRRMLGLALATATLAGTSAIGAATAQAAPPDPNVAVLTVQECLDRGGIVTSDVLGKLCTYADGHVYAIDTPLLIPGDLNLP
ncbi:hypothetical protein [Streptomyces sp. NPDC048428]|uniref:hypothetical protein n=1 Tax=Streptomyces sp. NPDC048428 TaxID=3154503 RepID=UPI003443B99C